LNTSRVSQEKKTSSWSRLAGNEHGQDSGGTALDALLPSLLLHAKIGAFNVFRYITFRTVLAILSA
jgi:hypothetical protein